MNDFAILGVALGLHLSLEILDPLVTELFEFTVNVSTCTLRA
jgi:hypothetical protein